MEVCLKGFIIKRTEPKAVGNEKKGMTYNWMTICKSVIDRHIFKEPADVIIEEALDFRKVELRVDEDGTKIRFYDVGETLWGLRLAWRLCVSWGHMEKRKEADHTFGGFRVAVQ